MSAEIPERFPFSLTDELFFHIDRPETPFSIQMEVRLNTSLELDRLREALATAMSQHPMMRAALAPWSAKEQHYFWAMPEEMPAVPLDVMAIRDDQELMRARMRLQSTSVGLEKAPPFHCLLARHDDGDYLMINTSHIATDATGAYRFLSSVLRAYARLPDPQPDDLDFMECRDLVGQFGSRGLTERFNRVRRLAAILGSSLTPPARIASDGADKSDGVSILPLLLSKQQTSDLQKLRLNGSTINDVLLATLHLTISDWNKQHHQRGNRISLMMPMNTRPAERRFELAGNLSLWVAVQSRKGNRVDFPTLLAEIQKQTDLLKEHGTAGLLVDLLHEIRSLPLWIKQWLPNLLPLTGNRFVDSSVLHNLGKLPSPLPDDNKLKVTEMWFSPPCRLPMGLAIGAATYNNQLHLAFRYSHHQFDAAGAQAFCDLFMKTLSAAHEQVKTALKA
ncbi:MAG: hypothetical protein P1U67_10920 [Alcanivoracaceae bacterium]|nr:hypothetical protein [Alcanivoracaceae bacterium]